MEVRSLAWRSRSWSQLWEPLAQQSLEDLMEVEVHPEQSIEARARGAAESRARHQDKVPGVEGSLPGDSCSEVSALQNQILRLKPSRSVISPPGGG